MTCPTCDYPVDRDGTCRPCYKDRIYRGFNDKLLRWGKLPAYLKYALEDAERAAEMYD